jgi:hypothetical protein
MDNYFLFLKKQGQLAESKSISPEKRKAKNDQLALQAKQRIETWINENDMAAPILESNFDFFCRTHYF